MKSVARFVLSLLILSSATMAADQGPHYISANGVAIDGYDVVGYFTHNQAIRGNKDFAATHASATYHFSSTENVNAFKASPEKYLPSFGGWCAFAVGAKNTKFTPDPKTFKIYNGRLLLFYNGEHGNTSVFWNQDEQALLRKADANWKALSKG
jgi:YHS domain-containing protein